ncbi:MAG: site-specific integrase [Clostridia bacterium]|nr:site-specific integrase [Clostridia bacterium]
MAKKRGNGEGSIRQTKEGYWEARIMIGYNEKGKPKYKVFSSKTRSEVSKKLSNYISGKKALTPEVVSQDTVAQWLQKWLDTYVAQNVKSSTRVSYEGIVKHQLIPQIGHIKLTQLKKSDIENMYSTLLINGRADGKGGLAIKTLNNIALCLHKALQTAYENEYIVKNPASVAKVPTLKSANKEKKEIKILPRQEQKQLMAVCDNSPYGMGIFTTLYTGVRIAELLGIMWSDIDFEKKTISISRQVNRVHDYSPNATAQTRLGIQNDTKTKTSTRVISMNDILSERLLQYKAEQAEHIRQWGKAYNDLGMVFAREDGFYIDPVTFRDNYNKILAKAGLDHYTFHALRHTFATRALEAGIPIKVVSKILGHASVQITMDTYQHVLPELQNEAMNRIAEYMS